MGLSFLEEMGRCGNLDPFRGGAASSGLKKLGAGVGGDP